jgi:hypothetical protein
VGARSRSALVLAVLDKVAEARNLLELGEEVEGDGASGKEGGDKEDKTTLKRKSILPAASSNKLLEPR